MQFMTFEQAEAYQYNPFDVTKVWRFGDFPKVNVGRLVLDRNPENYFAEIEQLAFAPANMIPGIEASPDKMLMGRMFAYTDTQRHRIGPNFPQVPVNKTTVALTGYKTYTRDGTMSYDNQGSAPNYFPNSLGGPPVDPNNRQSVFPLSGDVARTDTGDQDNFSQVTIFWNEVLTPAERQRLVDNIASHLINAREAIQIRTVNNFRQVSPEFGDLLADALGALAPRKKARRRL
jgi:catalase